MHLPPNRFFIAVRSTRPYMRLSSSRLFIAVCKTRAQHRST